MKKTEENKKDFSKEEESCVQCVIRSSNYYEILGIEKSCEQVHIKRAYRRKAMKVHPDRNKHPLSDEAFKKVGQAFYCLNDPEKREFYDQNGFDPNDKSKIIDNNEQMFANSFGRNSSSFVFRSGPNVFRFNGGGGGNPFADDFFFNLFDTFNMENNAFERRTQRTRGNEFRRHPFVVHNENLEALTRKIVGLVVIMFLFMFALSWVGNIFEGRSNYVNNQFRNLYSFQPSHIFNQQLTCEISNSKIPYFVRKNFDVDVRRKHQLDQVVYQDYGRMLLNRCHDEQSEQQLKRRELKRLLSDEDNNSEKIKIVREELFDMKMENCERYENIYQLYKRRSEK